MSVDAPMSKVIVFTTDYCSMKLKVRNVIHSVTEYITVIIIYFNRECRKAFNIMLYTVFDVKVYKRKICFLSK